MAKNDDIKNKEKQFYDHKEKGMELASEPGNNIGYTILFNGIIDIMSRKDIKPQSKSFYILLCAVMDQNKGTLFYSNKKLAELFGVSESVVKGYIGELKKAGLIERVRRLNNSSYTIIKPIPQTSKRKKEVLGGY